MCRVSVYVSRPVSITVIRLSARSIECPLGSSPLLLLGFPQPWASFPPSHLALPRQFPEWLSRLSIFVLWSTSVLGALGTHLRVRQWSRHPADRHGFSRDSDAGGGKAWGQQLPGFLAVLRPPVGIHHRCRQGRYQKAEHWPRHVHSLWLRSLCQSAVRITWIGGPTIDRRYIGRSLWYSRRCRHSHSLRYSRRYRGIPSHKPSCRLRHRYTYLCR